MKLRFFSLGAGMSAALLLPAVASAAATCKAIERPFIQLTAEVKPPDRIIAEALAQQLTAELDARGIDLCESSAAIRKPVGRVLLRIERTPAGPTTALIRIGDEVTDKRVERTLDLTHIPADSRPLSVAAAADELLRASWAELLIEDAPRLAEPAPAAVVTAVQKTVKPVARSGYRFETGAFATGSVFAHRTGVGGGLRVGLALPANFAAYWRVAAEHGLTTTSTHGAVNADTTSFGVGLEYAMLSGAFSILMSADTRAVQVHYAAVATSGNRDNDSSDWAWLSGWGPRFCLDVGAARMHWGAAALVGIRPSRATDAGREVSSLGRLGGEATLGVSLRL
jgi:hypothetical protein